MHFKMCFLFQIIESLVKNGYSWSLKACGGCSRTRDQGKFQRPFRVQIVNIDNKRQHAKYWKTGSMSRQLGRLSVGLID